jgi:hypothetical protein
MVSRDRAAALDFGPRRRPDNFRPHPFQPGDGRRPGLSHPLPRGKSSGRSSGSGSHIYDGWFSGDFFPNPQRAWTILNVQVTLQHVADLSDVAEQLKIGTSAQELTGDWRGYLERSAGTPVSGPTGPAPTQDLGQALYNMPGLEGFRTISSRMPTHRTLIVFPNKLRQGSRIVFTHPATRQTHTIP